MDTQFLIETLASDRDRKAHDRGPSWLFLAVLAAGTTGVFFFGAIGLRPDLFYVWETARFLSKFAITGTLAVTAFLAMRASAHPGVSMKRSLEWLFLPGGLLALSVAAELFALSPDLWATSLTGMNFLFCVIAIISLGTPLLIMFLWALRRQAPTRPALAGAMAGLAAASMAALFYTARCPNDSPLFVAAWYSFASLILVAAGAFAGNRVLRW
ncbi:NrsF family protein [Aurantimonas sp. C2-6-R+9]|uniref:NrsF family protein n=1 Tax=unclassified Aurantimonas TaxID=2638230 RepID=UPI002E173430|nr:MULTISPECIES: NrsF family protein [unclassified Aurantimonas]MEC5289198.1 NrsF family protein [Aurantimonas sp. C2-3-R2]MEC5380166.1 NrsF family protein [Aurantimonas sp. C2-6-R+9]MEC5410352.1 NrsF family protein [Aurantimonas sp. C2-4-R8]